MSYYTITMRKDFGEWLRKEIKKRGKTQREFAELIGIEQPHLSRILNGTRNASNETLNRIADLLCYPQSVIHEMAGCYESNKSEHDIKIEHAIHLLSKLDNEDIDEIIGFMKLKLEHREKPIIKKSREKPPAQMLLKGQ